MSQLGGTACAWCAEKSAEPENRTSIRPGMTPTLEIVSRSLYRRSVPASPLIQLRKICLALPEAHEVEAWGEPTFRVKNKLFAMYADSSNHHGNGRPGVWIKSTHVNQDLLIHEDPDRYFKPPYVGPSGWVGVYLDKRPSWSTVADLLRDAYLLTAPRKISAALDAKPRTS